jgi:hypothetical protein
MTKSSRLSDVLHATVANLVPLVVMWLIGFALMRVAEHYAAPATLKETGTLFAIILGAGLAWRLRGRIALFLLAVFFAEIGSLLVAHLVYRVDRVNGGPVQAAILVASLLGVAVGSLINRKRELATAS